MNNNANHSGSNWRFCGRTMHEAFGYGNNALLDAAKKRSGGFGAIAAWACAIATGAALAAILAAGV